MNCPRCGLHNMGKVKDETGWYRHCYLCSRDFDLDGNPRQPPIFIQRDVVKRKEAIVQKPLTISTQRG